MAECIDSPAAPTAREPVVSIVVVQPTPFCNIACDYCYLPERSDRSKLSPEVLRLLFEKLFASGWASERLTVIWHAGEPLVLPPTWYAQAFELIEALRPAGVDVRHSFQTNGMLLSKAWCELFRQWNVGVGISVDGPRRFNDAHRRGRDGRSTFDRTVAGMRLLRSEKVPFHVISVLTDESMDAPDELLQFYRSEGVEDVCFNVEESEGSHVSALFAGEEPGQRYRRFLARFWQAARSDDRIRFIREIDGMIARVFRPGDDELWNVQVEPFAMLNVDCHGNVSSFSPELLGLKNPLYDDFIIGNVKLHTLAQMRESAAMRAMTRDIGAGVARCRATCDYYSVCAGGAPVNKLSENGSFDSDCTHFCALTQKVPTDLVLDAFEGLQQRAGLQPPAALMASAVPRPVNTLPAISS